MNTQKRNLPKESEMCGNGKGELDILLRKYKETAIRYFGI